MKGLCGHQDLIQKGHRIQCTKCGSFWDSDYINQEYTYDNDYPEDRNHHSEFIGKLKTKTLKKWVNQNKVELENKSICEIGFGGAYPLSYLYKVSRSAYGVEAAQSNIDHAAELGIEKTNLFKVDSLPEILPEKIDLWVFQDSFEHILEVEPFMQWLISNSSSKAEILMILPQANSLSDRLMGTLWPHKLPDHKFHWSKPGLTSFMNGFGFKIKKEFYPLKYISVGMIIAHLTHKLGLKFPIPNLLKSLSFPFNFGEQGLLLELKNNESK